MKFTQVLNVVSGKVTYFFSNDGRFPVNEQICSANILKAELDARKINHTELCLYALGNGQYGFYAESASVMH
ncbi:hypothetical protein A6046_00955 [[Haemophilus] ducreyi]|uniref:Uncharacterized protein n=2 Tax=Haemophilus ducreyi TaxID=730 RepID=Q7VMM3_HAEDU|nr:hypothetical protein [[Haemophilus] ducreyi]AAP95833.1 hypothetical protein HD_0952 [[Haemophilus] ducreyi 35000HP]AKO30862.1 hypothetical protein RY60_03755 [[Haemophilus] ducreyi]AKO32300.1 hypothetical protein RZ57_03760 [[Haemophilus] ducreyi]AKO33754.1 hypothetical protein RZ58_03775 [[Haemophilus] ducreyi]AKO35202.1 hypothetical protein RZ59_03740 [[Haemophilus] ducreyi]